MVAERHRKSGIRPPRPHPAAELTPAQAARLHQRRGESGAQARGAAAPPEVHPESGPGTGRSVDPPRHTETAWIPAPDLGAGLMVRMAGNQIQVRLPYPVDVGRLNRRLQAAGYKMDDNPHLLDPDGDFEPDVPGTQSWGPNFDWEGYFPYTVLPDPEAPGERSIFAFPPQPEDVVCQGTPGTAAVRLELGPRSRRALTRWLPELAAAARTGNGDRP